MPPEAGSSLTSLCVAFPPSRRRCVTGSCRALLLPWVGFSASPGAAAAVRSRERVPSFEAPLRNVCAHVRRRGRTHCSSLHRRAWRLNHGARGAEGAWRRAGRIWLPPGSRKRTSAFSSCRQSAFVRCCTEPGAAPCGSGLEERRGSPSTGFRSFGSGDFQERHLPEPVLAQHCPTPAA